jgi:hypothetical protein
VSRALAAVVALALAAVLSLAPGQNLGGDSASAASCAWQQYSKRVVKRVKRNGRVRRVVHVKHWWNCTPFVEPPAVGIPPAVLPDPVAPPSPEVEPPPRRVSVTAKDDKPGEFSFGLSRLYVAAGEVTIELDNSWGQDAHNLNVRLEGNEDPPQLVGEAERGERRVGHLNLTAGTYRLWCSLPQHEEWGMNVDLEVRGG